MRVITVCNHKGGCGKTTTSINLAAYLALKDKKVLVIDLDPQGAASTGLGIDKWHLKSQMYDVMVKDTPLQDAILPTEIPGLFIAPCNIDLSGAEPELSNQIAPALGFSPSIALRPAPCS
jgi:chromosome partitioning protein